MVSARCPPGIWAHAPWWGSGQAVSQGLRLWTLLILRGEMTQQDSSHTFCFIASERGVLRGAPGSTFV